MINGVLGGHQVCTIKKISAASEFQVNLTPYCKLCEALNCSFEFKQHTQHTHTHTTPHNLQYKFKLTWNSEAVDKLII